MFQKILSIFLLVNFYLGFARAEIAKPSCPDGYTLELHETKNAGLDIKGNLTGKWHIEYIGADFAKKYLKNVGGAPVQNGILDGGLYKPQKSCENGVFTNENLIRNRYEMHGFMVAEYFSGSDGASDLGVSHSIVADLNFRKDRGEMQELAKAKMNGLRVLNFSMGAKNSEAAPRQKQYYDSTFRALDALGTIIVTAAGNDGEKTPEVLLDKKEFPGIVVGGLDPNGHLWTHSQHSNDVNIIAPAALLRTFETEATKRISTGTSLAAPLVAGSIANTVSILSSFTRKQSEILLSSTGLKLQGNIRAPNGLKMLNSYKMVRVAERIRKKIRSGPMLTGKILEDFISKELQDPNNYDFKDEANALIKSAEKVGRTSCEKKWAAIAMFREAFLLSGEHTARVNLVELYNEVGYSINADFYKKLPVKRRKNILSAFHDDLKRVFCFVRDFFSAN